MNAAVLDRDEPVTSEPDVQVEPPAAPIGFVMTDPRVLITADVEAYVLGSFGDARVHTSTGITLEVEYDLGHAKRALSDLEYAYGRAKSKLLEAIHGEALAKAREAGARG